MLWFVLCSLQYVGARGACAGRALLPRCTWFTLPRAAAGVLRSSLTCPPAIAMYEHVGISV